MEHFSFSVELSLPSRMDFSLVAASGGYSLIMVCGLLIAIVSLVAEQASVAAVRGPWSTTVVTHRLSCTMACGIFLV